MSSILVWPESGDDAGVSILSPFPKPSAVFGITARVAPAVRAAAYSCPFMPASEERL